MKTWKKECISVTGAFERNGVAAFDNPANMSVQETARCVKISINTVYKWVFQGKLPHRKIGGKKLGFAKEELDKFLASQRVPGDEEFEREATRRAITSGARRNYSRRT